MEGAYNVIVSNKLSIGALYCQWNFGTVLISQRPQTAQIKVLLMCFQVPYKLAKRPIRRQ